MRTGRPFNLHIPLVLTEGVTSLLSLIVKSEPLTHMCTSHTADRGVCVCVLVKTDRHTKSKQDTHTSERNRFSHPMKTT